MRSFFLKGVRMSVLSIDAISFCREVAKSQSVWTIMEDGAGPRAVKGTDGELAMPLWSSRDRVIRFIKNVKHFQNCHPLEIPWPLVVSRWVPRLDKDKIQVGINWTGISPIGYEFTPEELVSNVEAHIGTKGG
jgi:hypothetical protein